MGTPAANGIDAALRRFFAAHAPAGRRLAVAFSGGMDSSVLLHALTRWRKDNALPGALAAIHVHHGLSADADAWAAFCAERCGELGVPLDVVRVDVPRDGGEGLEAAARRERYRAFAGAGADWLALAHHRDDQAETVLLNLLRGAGPAGAAGMPAGRTPVRGPRLIRPLLDAPRADLARYAAEYGLRWIDDESNADRRLRRNFLRHEILPALERTFPAARPALARAAGHFAEAAHLLDQLAEIDAAAARRPTGRIGLAAFNRLAPERARNVLRHAWAAAGFRAPEARWLEEARRQLATSGAESSTCVATPDGQLRVYRGELYFVGRHEAGRLPQPLPWRGEAELPWGAGAVRFTGGLGIGIARRRLASGEAQLRPRQGGERLKPQHNRPRRPLRKLLQEAAMAPWEREGIPLLWVGGRLAWVGGLGVDADFACPPDEAGWLPVWTS